MTYRLTLAISRGAFAPKNDKEIYPLSIFDGCDKILN
jgi:hypothetical protein